MWTHACTHTYKRFVCCDDLSCSDDTMRCEPPLGRRLSWAGWCINEGVWQDRSGYYCSPTHHVCCISSQTQIRLRVTSPGATTWRYAYVLLNVAQAFFLFCVCVIWPKWALAGRILSALTAFVLTGGAKSRQSFQRRHRKPHLLFWRLFWWCQPLGGSVHRCFTVKS